MDKRKTYVRPAVESEVMVEQTSLACNVIMGPDNDPLYPSCGPSFEITGSVGCWGPLLKGGNWDPSSCSGSYPQEGESCAVQYS